MERIAPLLQQFLQRFGRGLQSEKAFLLPKIGLEQLLYLCIGQRVIAFDADVSDIEMGLIGQRDAGAPVQHEQHTNESQRCQHCAPCHATLSPEAPAHGI